MDNPELLIVDDEPVNIQVLSAVLKDRYRIRFAVSGEQALAMVQDHPPDLILLDIMMPDMSGIELCKLLKAKPATQSVPILFVTSNQEREVEVEGLSVGAMDFIYKPIRPHLVRARVANYLELKSARDQLAG
ncbi:response regulator [Acanthopleuribacter pedis]|uniref:Response regulator n=1 Tax=Acanthopleuribacter pedis TaxID=442870 RepID=A0A8J7Q125_9BACT|nr:response regulator [Acanthopleuribacter pedis]MBO1317250.1 response regulator [Acanthopleuribacter pedis]MBO1318557.1 response regulator [Acanthopleuribacter pedis]